MFKKDVLDINNSIWGIEASRILGISRVTFWSRIRSGIYKVKCVRCPAGYRYSIHDVFKMAHPKLKDKQLEELILDYRLKKVTVKKRKNKKAGVKQ